jgi:hypothetical protein
MRELGFYRVKTYREDKPGPGYKCGKCGLTGYRLWRLSHTFLDQQELYCAECGEQKEAEAIEKYANHHHPELGEVWFTIGDLLPARPTPDGDTFWGHTSGDVVFWYLLPQYTNPVKQVERMKVEQPFFIRQMGSFGDDWCRTWKEKNELDRQLNEMKARMRLPKKVARK